MAQCVGAIQDPLPPSPITGGAEGKGSAEQGQNWAQDPGLVSHKEGSLLVPGLNLVTSPPLTSVFFSINGY
jgi:hypothetical protein